VLGGYQFMKYVAAEVQYNDLGSPEAGGTSFKISGYSVAAVGIYPINDQWSVFARLGYASTKLGSPIDNSKSDVTYGIGGQYNIDRAWGVRVNYDQYKVETPDPGAEKATTSVPSIGVVYRFW
jgi:OOP family OmpA-OmpF porin